MTDAVGVDVGGTAIKAVLLSATGEVLAETAAPTPKNDPSGAATADVIAACADQVGRGVPVGFTSPGVVDEAAGVTVDSVNLNWRNVPIRALVEQRLGRPVGFGHDVRTGGLAELRAIGAVQPDQITAFVAIGTGLSAAVFLGERAIVGNGWVGEVGQIVLPDGPHVGKRIEEVASAAVLAARMGTAGAADVAALVAAGDPKAVDLWDDTVAVLSLGLAALIASIAPGTLILGGGLAQAGELLFAPTRSKLASLLPDVPLPRLLPARHGRLAGAVGAAMLGRARSEA